MLTPDETARLLHNGRLMLRWSGLTKEERGFLIGVRARHKKNPRLELGPREARWLAELVARWQAETLGEEAATEGQAG
jgi:hypothetical protein